MNAKKLEKPNREIDSVRIYQAVQFDKSNHTYFSTRNINREPAKEITINSEWGGVEIKSKTDHIFIPFTNVSAINFKSPLRIKNAELAEKAKGGSMGVKAHEIKRPS